MRLLELFSGTGSVGAAFEAAGWQVTSMDIDLRCPADVHADIMAFDFSVWSPGHFDAIWASPPCTQYSVARTFARRPRDFEAADALAQRTKDIICYLCPRVWFIENPDSGYLKTREVLERVPFLRVDYCMYGAPYRKRTRIWTNARPETANFLLCNKACGAFVDGRHVATAQRGPSRTALQEGINDRFSLSQLHALPRALCEQIERAARVQLLLGPQDFPEYALGPPEHGPEPIPLTD